MPPKQEKFGHVMIDLETLNTTADAVILSIGAVKFNEKNIADNGFYRVISIDSNLFEHRTISERTLAWWMDQSEKAKAVFTTAGRVTLEQALNDLREFFGTPLEAENTQVWSNGASFDIPMLEHAYGKQGAPWKFYNARCFRTIKSLPSARAIPAPANAGAHNALFDAIAQAQHLQAIWAAGVGK